MKNLLKKNLIQLNLLLKINGKSRANYLRKKRIFREMGDYVTWRPFLIPSDPDVVSLGNNVHIAANVRFITHDMFFLLFNYMDKDKPKKEMFKKQIAIGNNVAIGANAVLLYGVTLNDNTIVAAGSVVTKTFPKGSIIGGNPAKIIGSFNEFKKKREIL